MEIKKANKKFQMKDWGFITDCKAGYMDNGVYKHYKWYEIWCGMILRCYDINNKDFYRYGGVGIGISFEFHTASVFRDFYLENNPTGELVVDKDISGLNCYSREGIRFVTQKENSKHKTGRKYNKPEEKIKESRKHEIEWYENNAVTRANFKRRCKQKNLIFEYFEEIPDHIHEYPNGRKAIYYRYKLKAGKI